MDILAISDLFNFRIPFFASNVAAGFPSPADDYVESQLDLNSYLVSSPSSTFFARLDIDTSLLGGVKKGSVLIVDRSITPTHNKTVVAVIKGKFSLCKICINSNEQSLITSNLKDAPVIIDQNSYVWGVVTSIITKLQ